jgi:uncharacterized protein (TIGR03083 family)
MSNDDNTWSMIHAERARSADMLEALTPEQWESASLCGQWSVKMVAAHMMNAGEQTGPKFIGGVVANGFNFNKMMDRQARASATVAPDEIIRRIRARTTTTNKPPAPPMAMLGEVVVHGNDIRGALGIADNTSSEAKIACLDMFKGSNFPVPAKKAIAGLHLQATDADWSYGSGPDVRGTLVQLLMAVATRQGMLDSLDGDGVGLLRSRVTK